MCEPEAKGAILSRLAIFLVLVSCRCYHNHNSGKKIETELRVSQNKVPQSPKVSNSLSSTSPSCPSCPSHSTSVAPEPTDSHSSKLLENVKDGDQGPEHPKLALYRLFDAAKQGDRPQSPTGFIGLTSGNQTWLGNLRSIEL